MMKNLFLEKIEKKERPLLGTFFHLGSSSVIECLGGAGLDFVIIDTEHGPTEVENAMDFIRAANLRGITPFVRVREVSRAAVLKMMDIGAQALVVPCIRTVDEVKKLVEYGKYFPLGKRGVAFGRESVWGMMDWAGDIEEYFKISNRETMFFPQCETVECLEHIEEVVTVEGISGIFIGPYDLSTALGKPAQFEDPEFKAALKKIIKACKDAGKYCMILAGTAEDAKRRIEEGIDAVALNADACILVDAYRKMIEEVNN